MKRKKSLKARRVPKIIKSKKKLQKKKITRPYKKRVKKELPTPVAVVISPVVVDTTPKNVFHQGYRRFHHSI